MQFLSGVVSGEMGIHKEYAICKTDGVCSIMAERKEDISEKK